MAAGIEIKQTMALEAMTDTDDSIGEIDAMIPRLLKMKKQLLAQKEYIEVAIKDSQNIDNISATDAIAAATYSQQPLVVDPRVLLYKHQARLQRLNTGTTTTNGDMGASITTAGADGTQGTDDDDPDVKRAQFSNGRKAGIFKSDQQLTLTNATLAVEMRTATSSGGTSSATDYTRMDNKPFKSVDLQCTKKFLIGVNAILTHPNDIANTGDITTGTATHTVAIGTIGSGGTASDVTAPDNDINTGTYIAGNKHLLTAGTIRGLVMQTNEHVAASVAASAVPADNATAATHLSAMVALRGFGL